MKEKKTVLIIAIIILILLVLGLGAYIAYDKIYSTNNEPTKTEEKQEKQDTLAHDLALNLGKNLYFEARDIAYNLCFLGGYYADLNTCYTMKDGKATEDTKCNNTSEIYYQVINTKFKDHFTKNGLKQYETYMNKGDKFVIGDNYYIPDGVGDCYQSLLENNTKLSIKDINAEKIIFNVVEQYCDLEYFDKCKAGDTKYMTDVNTTFTIVKDKDSWKIEDFTDSYNKYLSSGSN